MASVAEIAPLSTQFDMPTDTGKKDDGIQQEVAKLSDVIAKRAQLGLKSATQAVVQNVPDMISQLTQDIKSGSIDSFGKAINKLNLLIDKLGINLRDYNSELADTVDRFRGDNQKMQEELARLREQGIRAEIDESTNTVKIITKERLRQLEAEKEVNLESIETNKREIEERQKLLNLSDQELEKKKQNREEIEQEIRTRAERNENLAGENRSIDERTSTTVDTGRDMGGFSKLAELKEAFMVIPDTINESFGQVKQVATTLFAGVMKFVRAPLQTIGKLFKSIANVFKSARALIALKVIAVIAAFQFFAEKIEAVGDFFVGVWKKITGFFQGIVDWFRESAVGKFFFGDKLKEDAPGEGRNQSLDEGTYEIGETNEPEKMGPMQSKNPNRPFYDRVSGQIIQPDNPNYDVIKQKQFQDTQGYLTDEASLMAAAGQSGEVKSVLTNRDVVGDTSLTGSTAAALKNLSAESIERAPPSIANMQNNNVINNNQSTSSSVNGFVSHEPDNSFKIVRQSSTDGVVF